VSKQTLGEDFLSKDNNKTQEDFSMKKSILVLTVLLFVIFMVGCENSTSPLQSDNQVTGEKSLAKKGGVPANDGCTTIQSGLLLASDGSIIETGYDEWGYNYQAHLFNGYYCDAYRDDAWCQAYKDVKLSMKWNDAWLSNKDCDGDGLLDRHNGFATYRGSGAWITNHQSGEYELDGKIIKWNYFVKIVAAPLDADLIDGIWYNADGVEIGPVIWGEFAIIQQVENDPGAGIHGLQYVSPDHAGFGGW